jgi:glucose/mannose transport system permease protein
MSLIGLIQTTVQGNSPKALLRRVLVGGAGEDVQRKHVVAALLSTALLAYFLSPLYTAMVTAFKTQTGFLTTLPISPPTTHFTVETWGMAWDALSGTLLNSLLMTVPAMFLSAVLGSFAAFGLTMVDWRGQVGLVVLFALSLFLPKQAIAVPLAQFWRQIPLDAMLSWALTDRYINVVELILTHTAFGTSVCTVLFRGYYLTIGQDIVEAARVDGASLYSIYWNIIRPLSYPMFMVVFIFQFTTIYNEFFFGLILTGGTEAAVGAPVTLGLQELNSGREALFNVEMAGALIVALPTLVVYLLFGEEFARGVRY